MELLNSCEICGEKWFATQHDLEKHKLDKHKPSTNQKTYVDLLNSCKICGEKWFATKLDLEKHIAEKHNNKVQPSQVFTCFHCHFHSNDRYESIEHCRKNHSTIEYVTRQGEIITHPTFM